MSVKKLNHETDLIQLASISAEKYNKESLAALTVYSLYWLQEWELRTTLEAISVLNWKLFPERFAMLGFEQFPDALRTNRSLLQGQPKYRNWLTGTATKGYKLNERGIEKARFLCRKLGLPIFDDGSNTVDEKRKRVLRKTDKRVRTVDPVKEVKKIRKSKLFMKWESKELSERDVIHLYSLLTIFDHTPSKTRKQKIKQYLLHAQDVKDEDVINFLKEVKAFFRSSLNK